MAGSIAGSARRARAETEPGAPTRKAMIIGAVAPAVHAVLMIPSYAAGDEFRLNELLMLVAVASLISVLLLTVAAPRLGPRGAIVVSVLAVLSVGAFWTLLTVPLAACAFYAASREPVRQAGMAARAIAAVALLLLATAISVSAFNG